jgi:N-sulfoglucosamine sulfohydrolase
MTLDRRNFVKSMGVASLGTVLPARAATGKRPNILFCISDDQSWLHAGAMGDPVVKTPAFDRVAREGVLFNHAFCDAPSCAPSRSAILTGQHIWRLKEAGNIHSKLPEEFATYSNLLEEAGYAIGSYSKAWAPGQFKTAEGWVHSGRSQLNPGGPQFKSFAEFHQNKPADQPFCFWLGSRDAHRPYEKDTGRKSGMDPAKAVVPPHLPDNDLVRNDILDYYFEVERWDGVVADALAVLEKAGELDNTLVVVTSDNGMPFPRAKATLYDYGTRMPLAIRWPSGIKSPGRTSNDFVLLSDMAPTFLEAAGVKVPGEMTGQSLSDVFDGQKTKDREAAYVAMERHDGCRKGGKGYPCRAIRTDEYMYIYNFEPTRWPSGSPDASVCARAIPYGEIDGAPTKTFMMEHRNEHGVAELAELSFGMRPAEELYDLKKDPGQMHNVAGNIDYLDDQQLMREQLFERLRKTRDPRVVGGTVDWDYYPYYGGMRNKDWKVDPKP